jgi:hypothetical protein
VSSMSEVWCGRFVCADLSAFCLLTTSLHHCRRLRLFFSLSSTLVVTPLSVRSVAALLGWTLCPAVLSGGYYELLRYAPLWLAHWIFEDQRATLDDWNPRREYKTRRDETRQETA